MSTALATIEEPTVTKEQLELVKKTVAKDATPDELKLYLYDCARQGVHPLDRLLHFTKRGNKYTPITSIDFMRTRAADSGEMAGSDDPVFDSDPTHGTNDPKRFPEFATVTVYRITQGQRFAYTATARWSEYKPEQNDFMWRKMPFTMLGKCAEACALRKAFPRQLAGLYANEEMDQADKGGYVVAAPAPPATAGATPAPAPAGDGRASGPALEGHSLSGDLTIKQVASGAGGSRAQVIFSDGVELPVYTPQLVALCEQILQEGVAVTRSTAVSKTSGKERLEDVRRVSAPNASCAMAVVPITAKDIPF